MTKLHWEAVGDGPPLVLLHGWGLHSGLWQPVLPALARTHRVYLVDLPGHGHSPVVAPYSFEQIVASVDATLADVAEPLTVVGWSLGGQVTLAWAAARPGRIARMVLVASSPKFIQSPDWAHAMEWETLKRFGDELRVAYRLTLQRFLGLQVLGSEDGRKVLAQMKARLHERAEPHPTVLQEGLGLLEHSDWRAVAATLPQPALVIGGDRDRLTPWEAGAELARQLPNGQFRLISDAAHAPFLSHRATFLQVIDEFLARS